jgi:hypothetical protein
MTKGAGPPDVANRYAAFLSYSREDRALSDDVHRALEGLGRPFFRLRGRRVFRDVANAAASEGLKAMLERAVQSSDCFILLATRSAAASDWVRFEVEVWLAAHDGKATNFLIVLCDGDIRWDDVRGDFDWGATSALPRALERAFHGEPSYCDVRGIGVAGKRLGLRNALFRNRIAEVVAPIDGRNKEELVGRYLAVRRQLTAVVAVVVLFLASLGGGLYNRWGEARRQTRIGAARQSLALAAEVFTAPGDPDNWPGALRAGLMQAQDAVRALMELLPSLALADENYLRDILETLPGELVRLPVRDVEGALVSDDGRRVLLDPAGAGPFAVWDVAADSVVARLADDVPVFSGDLRTFAWQEPDGRLVVQTSDARRPAARGLAPPVTPLVLSPDGQYLAYRNDAGNLHIERTTGGAAPVHLCGAVDTHTVTFSPDGTRIAAVCGQTLRVWSTDGVRTLATFALEPASFADAVFSDDGARIALATSRRVFLWSLDPPRQLANHLLIGDPDEDDDLIDRIGLDASGGRIAVNLDEDIVRCVDALTGSVVWPRLASWEFDEFGRNVPDAIANTVSYRDVEDGFTLFDACTGDPLARIVLDAPVRGRTYNPRARQLALTTDSGTVLVNLRPADLLAADELPGEVLEVKLAVGVPHVALRTAHHERLWDVERGVALLPGDSTYASAQRTLRQPQETLVTLTGDSAGGIEARLGLRPRAAPAYVASDDRRFLAVATHAATYVPERTGPDTVEVVDLAAGRIVARIPLATHAGVMRFGRAGHLAIAGNAVAPGESGFRVRVLEPATWTQVTDLQEAGRPECLAFSPDDALLAIGQRDNTTAVVNRAGNRTLVIPQAGRVVYCEFVGDAARIATIGSTTDRTVLRVTPASRAALARRLLEHDPWVR